ncbi:hypothetical protein D3C76_810560 [compost metagenome]
MLIGADLLAHLAQQLEIFRALESTRQFLLLRAEGIELLLHLARCAVVAIGQHVLQASDTQVGQGRVELGDIAHPVAAVDQATQATPAGEGEQGSE